MKLMAADGGKAYLQLHHSVFNRKHVRKSNMQGIYFALSRIHLDLEKFGHGSFIPGDWGGGG